MLYGAVCTANIPCSIKLDCEVASSDLLAALAMCDGYNNMVGIDFLCIGDFLVQLWYTEQSVVEAGTENWRLSSPTLAPGSICRA